MSLVGKKILFIGIGFYDYDKVIADHLATLGGVVTYFCQEHANEWLKKLSKFPFLIAFEKQFSKKFVSNNIGNFHGYDEVLIIKGDKISADDLFCLKEMAFNKNVIGEVINIGPDEEFITINQLADKLANQLRFNLNPQFVKGRPQEVLHATCSADKARKILGYKTKTSLDKGLEKMISFIKKRGTKKFRYHLDLEIINELTPKTWKDRLF